VQNNNSKDLFYSDYEDNLIKDKSM